MITLCLSLATLCFVQDVQETLRVPYVLLDVAVVDANGTAIDGLDVHDFVITDEGEKVDVEFFHVIKYRDALPPPVNPFEMTDQDPLPLAQTFIFLFDFSHFAPDDVESILAEMKHLFHQWPETPNQQFLIYDIDAGSITQGFTADVKQALADLEIYVLGFADEQVSHRQQFKQGGLVDLEEELIRCFPKSMAPSPEMQQAALEAGQICFRASYQRYYGNQVRELERRLGVLSRVMTQVERLTGPKDIYFVSGGIPLNVGQSGSELAQKYTRKLRAKANKLVAATPQSRSDISDAYAPHFIADSSELETLSLEPFLQQLGHLALRSRSAVHTFSIPISGERERQMASMSTVTGDRIDTGRIYATDQQIQIDGLQQLAAATGGLHFVRADLAKAIQRVAEAVNVRYMLGYLAPEDGKGRFRQVQVNCSRTESTTFHQEGYVSINN